MGIFDRLLGRDKPAAAPAEAPPISVALPALLETLGAILEEMAGEAPDPDLCRARLADTLRDGGIDPPEPERFDALAAALDEGGWARLDLVTLAARRGALGEALFTLAGALGAEMVMDQGFLDFARRSPLLTLELLRQSPLRLEELARRWLASTFLLVEGETVEASRAALDRLDYARLLAEVDQAKMSAEERLAYLKKLQEAHDASLPRRGKW
jgi:hypothetical protein